MKRKLKKQLFTVTSILVKGRLMLNCKRYNSREQLSLSLYGPYVRGRHSPYGIRSHSVTVLPLPVPLDISERRGIAGSQLTYPGGMEGCVDLGGLIRMPTEMVYLSLRRQSPIQVVTVLGVDQL